MKLRVIAGCMALPVVLSLVSQGHARPNYKKVFDATYTEIAKNKTNCAICHGSENDKKKLNHYGEALKKELGEPKVKDEEKIKKALKAIESGDCKTGKWKERLDAGKAPCEDKPDDHSPPSYISRQLNRDMN